MDNEALWDTYAHDMVRILAFDFLSSKCPDLYHTCCEIGQLGEIYPDSIRESRRLYRKRRSHKNTSILGNVSTGPHRENGAGVLPSTKCEELSSQIMEMYDEWQADHQKSVISLPWDFMKDPIIKSRYEKLVEESSTPILC